MTVTTVIYADGSRATIDTGHQAGTFAWVHEATLVATAYRQVGDYQQADVWQREEARREVVWRSIQDGKDAAQSVAEAGRDFVAPSRIAANIGDAIGDVVGAVGDVAKGVGKAATGAGETIAFLPYLLAGVVVVLVIVASKGNLRLSHAT